MGELKSERQAVLQEIFKDYDVEMKGELNAEQLQIIHQDIRVGGLSIPQVKESIKYVCIGDTCEQSEMFDLLQEMDRRYFLIQDFRWEFSMLDRNNIDTITEDQAKWFMQTVHGNFFSKRKWEAFLRHRAVPGSGVSFAEIEVLLCNIPSKIDILEEEEEERREKAEKAKREKERRELLEREKEKRKRQRQQDGQRLNEEEKRRRQEMEKKLQEDQEERLLREREKDEADRRKRELDEEEERGSKEAAERERREREQRELEEAKRRKEEEEERRRREMEEAENYERLLREAHEKEREYNDEGDRHLKRFKTATDDKLKREAEEAEKRARLKQREWKNKRIRYALKVAIKKRDRERLHPAYKDFKDAKLPDDDMDLPKAEKILREFGAKDGLMEAMINPHREGLDRHIDNLEKAIHFIKRHGFEYMLLHELSEAEKLLLQLKKRYKIYAEIMALDQPTVAEIKSYSKPPVLVHQVMTGVFVMLGHKEKEMKDWQNVRIWVGKTGKDGLKRRCLQYLKEPETVKPKDAERTRVLLENVDLDDVRDTSAGAATFFVWAWTMVEETEIRIQQAKEDAELLQKQLEEKKKQKAEKDDTEAVNQDQTADDQSKVEKEKEEVTDEEASKEPEMQQREPQEVSKNEDRGDIAEVSKNDGQGDTGDAGVEVQGQQQNEETQDEPTSKRVGKESKEMFTLSKTGKVKKSKEKK